MRQEANTQAGRGQQPQPHDGAEAWWLRGALRTDMRRGVLVALVFAVIWWLVAVRIRSLDIIPIWFDQVDVFLRAGLHLGDPYVLRRFVYTPWSAVFLVPLSGTPLPLAVLLQAGLHHVLIALLILKYGGNWRSVLVACSAFMALDNVFQQNLDWLVVLGLLVPPMWSGPLLLVKPQVASGVWLSYTRRDFIRASAVTLITVLIAFAIWGDWPLRMLANIRVSTLGQSLNMAPLELLPPVVAIAIGVALAWVAFRRRDPIVSIWAWAFFMPYITFYTLWLHFALICVRLPRFAMLVSGVIWLLYGRYVLAALFWQT